MELFAFFLLIAHTSQVTNNIYLESISGAKEENLGQHEE